MNSTYKEIERRVNESKKSKKINLDKLSLTTLPGSTTLSKLSSKHIDNIEELIFTHNLVHTIDDKTILTTLTNLERLDLSHNNLTTIHDLAFGSNGAPSSLTEINLSHNKLTEFPQFILSTSLSLTSLILTHNNLTTIPSGLFDQLTSLTSLDLSFNSLCSLPPGLSNLSSSLKFLSLRGNRITRAAEGTLGSLTSLTSLDLSDNRLARLPADVRGLGSLETLALAGNPWESPRAAVCEAGRDAVFAELERLASARASGAASRVVDLACAPAGGAVTFAVVACDPQGVPRITGGDDVRAALSGPERVEGKVEDNGSGVYVVSVAVAVPGTYKLDVTVNDDVLAGSPYTVHVWPSSNIQKDADTSEVEIDKDILSEIEKVKSKKNVEEDDEDEEEDEDVKNGKLLAEAVGACREYNIPVEVPEILICGAPGYEEVVEAVAGVFPVRIPRGCLRRPLVLSFIYNEKVAADPTHKPEITLMKDQLLGSSVPMGLRDAVIDDPSTLPMHIQRRNSAAASATAPVIIQFAGRYSLPHRIVVAPALPTAAEVAAASSSSDAEVQQAAASAFLDEKLRSSAAVVCVLQAMEWRLVQTSGWLPRLRAADPLLARTHFMFTGLSPFLATFHSPVALADFLRGRPGFKSCCFATLPPDCAAISALCASHAEYSAALSALTARDAAALERLWGDRELRASIGVQGLRRTLASALRAHYREVLPRLQQHIADTKARKVASAARLEAAREALDAPTLPAVLRAAATQRAVAFAAAVTATLRGSAAAGSVAAPLAGEAGTTLGEEVEAVLDTGFPLRGLVLADTGAVPRANARIYGGAQLDRLIAFFRASAQRAADTPPPFPDALAHCSACANKAAATVAPACQAARAEARAALVPLVNFLADAAILAVKRCADVADQMLDRKKSVGAGACAECSDVGGMVGLEEYSYLSTNVNGIFVELASTAIEQLRDDCVDQIERVQAGQIPQEDFGAPYLQAEAGVDAAAAQGKAEWLAEKMYRRMVTEEAGKVAARFYGELLDELSVRVPAETHATIMGFENERIAGMFKIKGIKDNLDDKLVALEEEIDKCTQKQKEISEVAIN